MQVDGTPYRSIWFDDESNSVAIIDQTRLPHCFSTIFLNNLDDAVRAIVDMEVRGAPLIGATTAYGVYLGLCDNASDQTLAQVCDRLLTARPTAVNLRWAVERMRQQLMPLSPDKRCDAARAEAALICDEDVATNAALGEHGATLIQACHEQTGQPVHILTHCNAGWLATVDWGTALAPVFKAHEAGIPVHVWVDETRPRNQGAHLTAWELAAAGIDHTLIVDNAGGHLMQQGRVDLCIVGTDRTASNGDVCNKIGTYLKALAAFDNDVPFYVALPSSTIDWSLHAGSAIPIENRSADEVVQVWGKGADDQVVAVQIAPEKTTAINPAFDVTPARLVSGLITERGVCQASFKGLRTLFPEQD